MSKIEFALGLAQKAGKLATGDTAVSFAVKSGRAYLILVAQDASSNSQKYVTDMAKNNDTPVVVCLSKDRLGQAIGKAQRTAVAILDKNFAQMVRKSLEQE